MIKLRTLFASDLENVLKASCYSNNIDLIKYLIEDLKMKEDINWDVKRAIKRNEMSKEIFDYLYINNSTNVFNNWEEATEYREKEKEKEKEKDFSNKL